MSGLTTPETSSTPHQENAPLRAEAADIAAAPFNRPSADVVFLTADNVEYHLHKIVLSLASPFFEDMFTLTQPSAELSGTVSDDERIRIAEDSETFGSVMRLLYPVADPPLTDRLRVEQMLEVALKYQMQGAIETLKAAWRTFIPSCPLQILAKACHLRLKEEIAMAAKEWKTQAVWSTDDRETDFGRTIAGASYVPEMAQLSAGFFYRFLRFLDAPSGDVPELLDPQRQSRSIFRVKSNRPLSHLTCGTDKEASLNASQSRPDILLRCRVDGVDVPAHEIVIRLASAQNLLAFESASTSPSGRTIYEVDADSRTLQVLLHICYPFPTVNLCEAVDLLDKMMSLAKRYQVNKAINYIKERFHTVSRTYASSLTCYFLARRWGWTVEASGIVGYIQMDETSTEYSHTMESSSAEIYLDLLKQRFMRCRQCRKLGKKHQRLL